MRLKQFTYRPVDLQHSGHFEEANKDLSGATHVETYTIDEKCFAGKKTLVVFAFFPDYDGSTPVKPID